MNFNRTLAIAVVVVFAGICAFALIRGQESRIDQAAASAPLDPNGSAVDPASPSTLTLLLSSSVAKQTFIDLAVADFNRRRLTVNGKVLLVKAEYGTSGDGWNEIKEGHSKPDLWSPGDESWIRIANEAWTGLHNRPLFDKVEPTVNVPLCIAMWEPMAIALGYPKPLGWADLVKLSIEPQGWGHYGHPEWGAFKWGHAHPNANSGFLTVVAEVYAFTQKSRNLSIEDLRAPALLESLSNLEHSVDHYGLSNVWIEGFMREKGPAYLSASVQYENAIIEGNRKSQNKPFKIVAIYPKEGTLIAQHPIAIPQGEWMTEERKAGAQKFIDYLLSPEAQAQAMQVGLRPVKPMPASEVFSSASGVLAVLPPSPVFEVPNEAVLRRITDLWLAAKKPASVMMLLDTSASMSGEPLEKAKAGAISFIEQMQGRDELEIRTFNHQIFQLSAAGSIAVTRESAMQKVRGLFASGGTHLYTVLQDAALDWIARKKRGANRHYGIVLMSDGQDEGSPVTLADLMDVLPKGDNPETIKIFTIAYGASAQRTLLQEIANNSNARTFSGSTGNIGQIYREISANF